MKKSLLFALLLLPLFVFPQHTIKGFFSPAEDFNWAILYRTTAGTAMYAADTRSNAQGEFTLTLNGDIAPGHYYIVYGTPQEEKNFNLIYNGREDVALTYSVEKGVRFTASRENVLWQNYVEAMAQLNSEIGTLYKGKKHRKKAFKKLFEEKDKMQQTYEAASQGLLVQNFIKASRPYIPKKYKYEAAEVYAKNTRAAYFKNTPVTNEFLQNSRFISRRI
ncbi:MAG: TlpA family protein disulfide reductase, partial [Marinirhabdus sp.]